jgi:hypothetical protein
VAEIPAQQVKTWLLNRPSRSGLAFLKYASCSLPLSAYCADDGETTPASDPAAPAPTYRSQSWSVRISRNAHLTIRTELTCKFCRPERCVRTGGTGTGKPRRPALPSAGASIHIATFPTRHYRPAKSAGFNHSGKAWYYY